MCKRISDKLDNLSERAFMALVVGVSLAVVGGGLLGMAVLLNVYLAPFAR